MKKYLHKHSKISRQHKKKSFKPKPKFGKAGFRWIEDLHNIHKGKEIWILGTGWSLDEFPDDFFKDKLTIAHRRASMAFPYCNYVWTGYSNGSIKKFLEFHGKLGFKKIILSLSGTVKPSGIKWLGKNWKDPIYTEKLVLVKLKPFKDKIGNVAKYIMKGKHCRYLCCETTLHFVIEAAIALGASKVTLAGCSHRAEEGRLCAQKRGLSLYYPKTLSEDPPVWRRARLGTGLLVQTFEPYGISIRRYFFGRGYEPIPTLRDLMNPEKANAEQ